MHRPRIDIGSWGDIIQEGFIYDRKTFECAEKTDIKSIWIYDTCTDYYYLFTIIPIIGSLVLMFYDYSVLGQTKFVGLKNFVKAFHDRVFWISIKNSVIFVVVVPIIQILSILLAVLVNKKLPGIGIFRTLFYIPVVTSMVAVSIMWGFIFDTSGIINTALKEWKVISMPLGFLSDKNTAMICLMFITIWQGLGYYMMMYLAGLQGIPQELCEAATIDGANAVKVFTRIKLPMLKPYIWFCSLNSVISAIGVFDVVFVLTRVVRMTLQWLSIITHIRKLSRISNLGMQQPSEQYRQLSQQC